MSDIIDKAIKHFEEHGWVTILADLPKHQDAEGTEFGDSPLKNTLSFFKNIHGEAEKLRKVLETSRKRIYILKVETEKEYNKYIQENKPKTVEQVINDLELKL